LFEGDVVDGDRMLASVGDASCGCTGGRIAVNELVRCGLGMGVMSRGTGLLNARSSSASGESGVDGVTLNGERGLAAPTAPVVATRGVDDAFIAVTGDGNKLVFVGDNARPGLRAPFAGVVRPLTLLLPLVETFVVPFVMPFVPPPAGGNGNAGAMGSVRSGILSRDNG
jgi:hypothetical protein